MLEYTGERMIPEAADGSTFWEHVQRYRFALPYLQQRRVLDIACGEGYGTAAIAAGGAAETVGVDISPESCAHATAKYGIDARVGSAESIPLPSASQDAIVSFETIEHLQSPDLFLNECHRVLTPGGRLIISTPNRPVYHQHSPHNAYHHHEMTLHEFKLALQQKFEILALFGQCSPLPRLLRMRGIRRLTSLFYRAVAPHVERAPSKDERSRVLDFIFCPNTWRDRYDPFVVRSMSAPHLQNACYLIAVANRRES
jgi:ubiquinone/menaquinone biosynthesis C-methylase UbiE